MPAPIPIIRFQFEWFPLFEALVDVRAGEGFGGVSNGDVATGAFKEEKIRKEVVDIHTAGLTSKQIIISKTFKPVKVETTIKTKELSQDISTLRRRWRLKPSDI